MMERENVAAYTPPGANYPCYVSFNRSGDYGLQIAVTIRGDKKSDGSCGDTVTATLTQEQFALLLVRALQKL